MRGLVIIASAIFATTAFAGPHRYSLADLQTLVGKGAYEEAFQHLGDIAPGERKAAWIDVGAAASAGLVAMVPANDGTAILVIDQIDRAYPQLLGSATYSKPRAEKGPKALAGCFARGYDADECVALAERFVAATPALAFEVAKVVRRGGSSASALPMFERVLGKDKSACKDEDAKLAILAGLDLSEAASAKRLMATCWDAIKDDGDPRVRRGHGR